MHSRKTGIFLLNQLGLLSIATVLAVINSKLFYSQTITKRRDFIHLLSRSGHQPEKCLLPSAHRAAAHPQPSGRWDSVDHDPGLSVANHYATEKPVTSRAHQPRYFHGDHEQRGQICRQTADALTSLHPPYDPDKRHCLNVCKMEPKTACFLALCLTCCGDQSTFDSPPKSTISRRQKNGNEKNTDFNYETRGVSRNKGYSDPGGTARLVSQTHALQAQQKIRKGRSTATWQNPTLSRQCIQQKPSIFTNPARCETSRSWRYECDAANPPRSTPVFGFSGSGSCTAASSAASYSDASCAVGRQPGNTSIDSFLINDTGSVQQARRDTQHVDSHPDYQDSQWNQQTYRSKHNSIQVKRTPKLMANHIEVPKVAPKGSFKPKSQPSQNTGTSQFFHNRDKNHIEMMETFSHDCPECLEVTANCKSDSDAPSSFTSPKRFQDRGLESLDAVKRQTQSCRQRQLCRSELCYTSESDINHKAENQSSASGASPDRPVGPGAGSRRTRGTADWSESAGPIRSNTAMVATAAATAAVAASEAISRRLLSRSGHRDTRAIRSRGDNDDTRPGNNRRLLSWLDASLYSCVSSLLNAVCGRVDSIDEEEAYLPAAAGWRQPRRNQICRQSHSCCRCSPAKDGDGNYGQPAHCDCHYNGNTSRDRYYRRGRSPSQNVSSGRPRGCDGTAVNALGRKLKPASGREVTGQLDGLASAVHLATVAAAAAAAAAAVDPGHSDCPCRCRPGGSCRHDDRQQSLAPLRGSVLSALHTTGLTSGDLVGSHRRTCRRRSTVISSRPTDEDDLTNDNLQHPYRDLSARLDCLEMILYLVLSTINCIVCLVILPIFKQDQEPWLNNDDSNGSTTVLQT